MARLYADENFDYRVVEELRKRGHDVLTANQAGQAGQGIRGCHAFAAHASTPFFSSNHTRAAKACHPTPMRAVITFNRRHFIRLHQQVQPHSGIIVCTDDRDFIALAARVHLAITGLPSLDNQLIRVNRPAIP